MSNKLGYMAAALIATGAVSDANAAGKGVPGTIEAITKLSERVKTHVPEPQQSENVKMLERWKGGLSDGASPQEIAYLKSKDGLIKLPSITNPQLVLDILNAETAPVIVDRAAAEAERKRLEAELAAAAALEKNLATINKSAQNLDNWVVNTKGGGNGKIKRNKDKDATTKDGILILTHTDEAGAGGKQICYAEFKCILAPGEYTVGLNGSGGSGVVSWVYDANGNQVVNPPMMDNQKIDANGNPVKSDIPDLGRQELKQGNGLVTTDITIPANGRLVTFAARAIPGSPYMLNEFTIEKKKDESKVAANGN